MPIKTTSMLKAKHITKKIKEDYRLIAISDIHGHLDRFQELLRKVHYQPGKDYLVIIGDFVEKGDQVLETIHYIQKLSKIPRCYILMGNCEWAMTVMLSEPELASQIPVYLKRISSNGIIRQLYQEGHYADGHETPLGIQKEIAIKLHDELLFMKNLPTTLKINDFLFVHAGVDDQKNYKECSLSQYLEMQKFMEKGHSLKETVIVGHLPTSNYNTHQINNDIIINEEKRIISIDGGTGVKMISQLNALVITSINHQIDYHQVKVQPLPHRVVTQTTTYEKKADHKISFPYFHVEILEEGEEFTKCFQEETNQILMIKNEFLYTRNKETYCLDDYTDHFLSIKQGEEVGLIGIYGQYAYCQYRHEIGWIELKYLGE